MIHSRYNPVGNKYYTQDEIDALIAAIGLDEVLIVDHVSPDKNIVLTNGSITTTNGNVNTNTIKAQRMLIGGVENA